MKSFGKIKFSRDTAHWKSVKCLQKKGQKKRKRENPKKRREIGIIELSGRS